MGLRKTCLKLLFGSYTKYCVYESGFLTKVALTCRFNKMVIYFKVLIYFKRPTGDLSSNKVPI